MDIGVICFCACCAAGIACAVVDRFSKPLGSLIALVGGAFPLMSLYAFDHLPNVPNFIILILFLGVVPMMLLATLCYWIQGPRKISKPLLVSCLIGIAFAFLSTIEIWDQLYQLGSV